MMSVSEDRQVEEKLLTWKVCRGLHKWVPAVRLILPAFPLSLCVFRFLSDALFHHLSHVLYKSYWIFSGKGMTAFYLTLLPLPISPCHSAIPMLPHASVISFLAGREMFFVLCRWNNGLHVFFFLLTPSMSNVIGFQSRTVSALWMQAAGRWISHVEQPQGNQEETDFSSWNEEFWQCCSYNPTIIYHVCSYLSFFWCIFSALPSLRSEF